MMLPSSSPISRSSLPSGRMYIDRALSITTGIGRGAATGTPMYPVSWRHTVTGTSRPTIAPTRAAHGPAALTTIGAAKSPLVVPTPVTRVPSSLVVIEVTSAPWTSRAPIALAARMNPVAATDGSA